MILFVWLLAGPGSADLADRFARGNLCYELRESGDERGVADGRTFCLAIRVHTAFINEQIFSLSTRAPSRWPLQQCAKRQLKYREEASIVQVL